MSAIDISEIFSHNRFPSGLAILPILLYFPIGILLAIIRLCIGIQAVILARILPRRFDGRRHVLRVMCFALGIVVKAEGYKHRSKSARVLVANYTTTLDHVAVSILHCYTMPSVWDLPSLLTWLLGYTDMGAREGKAKLIENCKKYLCKDSLPLLAFPEGATTSGQKGLLRFSVWPFALNMPVQPMVISVQRPFLFNINFAVVGSRWWQDVFWAIFVPYTTFNVRYLPLMEEGKESHEDFAKHVQTLMADELHIQTTNFTTLDKLDYAKRYLFRQPDPPSPILDTSPGILSPTLSESSSELTEELSDSLLQMVRQVKAVMPHVPVHAIKLDLVKTQDVDLTLQNILDGHVDLTVSEQTLLPAKAALKLVTLKEFPRSSEQRHLTLTERKSALLEFAKQKYIIRQGLQLR